MQLLNLVFKSLGKRRSVEVQKKLQAVELYNELKRYHEEKRLLISEMRNLLKYYYQVILPTITKDIEGEIVHTSYAI